MTEGVRTWAARTFGDDEFAVNPRRRQIRLWAIGAAIVLAFVVVAIVGYKIGTSNVADSSSAYQAGVAAGREEGAKAGARQGFASTFKPARERAFDAAYDRAYQDAYRQAFEDAELDAPTTVKVVGP